MWLSPGSWQKDLFTGESRRNRSLKKYFRHSAGFQSRTPAPNPETPRPFPTRTYRDRPHKKDPGLRRKQGSSHVERLLGGRERLQEPADLLLFLFACKGAPKQGFLEGSGSQSFIFWGCWSTIRGGLPKRSITRKEGNRSYFKPVATMSCRLRGSRPPSAPRAKTDPPYTLAPNP